MANFFVFIVIVIVLFRACSGDESASSTSDEGGSNSTVVASTGNSPRENKLGSARPSSSQSTTAPVSVKANKAVETKSLQFNFKDLTDAVINAQDAVVVADVLDKYAMAIPELRAALYLKCAQALRSGQSHDVVLSKTMPDDLKLIFGTPETRQKLVENLNERIENLLNQESQLRASMQGRSGTLLSQFEALVVTSEAARSAIESGKAQIMLLEDLLATDLAIIEEFKAFVSHSIPILGASGTSQKLADLFEKDPK